MRTLIPLALTLLVDAAHAETPAPDPKDPKEFVLQKGERKDPKSAKLKSTATEAAMRLTVVDKEKGAGIAGVVVCFTGPDGKKYYADETDADGYTELLVPISQTYEITYLSLGRSDVTAKATVDGRPNHNINLTLRYKRFVGAEGEEKPRVVLDDVFFDSGNAKLRPESMPRLERIYQYMAHKKSLRIEISGHTDNKGVAKENKTLSLARAQACKDYLVKKGIDGSRIVAVGHGDEQPIAQNDTEEGRQKNRRIEAIEL
jgi:outer membrane protein OmpA-like peptidoglycan-associated protein